MDDGWKAPSRRGITLVQAGLALLVAATLVAFSVVALQTGFAERRTERVEARGADGSGPREIILPEVLGNGEASGAGGDTTSGEPGEVAEADQVLGRRFERPADVDTDRSRPQRPRRGPDRERGGDDPWNRDDDDDEPKGRDDDDDDDSERSHRSRSHRSDRSHSERSERSPSGRSRDPGSGTRHVAGARDDAGSNRGARGRGHDDSSTRGRDHGTRGSEDISHEGSRNSGSRSERGRSGRDGHRG